MAYTRAWDETVPAGSVNAATIDTVFQQLRADLRERLDDIMADWTDDTVDPKRVKVASGTLANRPLIAVANTGEFYYATDTAEMYYYNGAAYVQMVGSEQAANYDDSQGAGSKASSETVVAYSLSLSLSGTTDGSGDLVIDLGELTSTPAHASPAAYLSGAVFSGVGTAALATVQVNSTTASTITVRCYDFAGAALGTTAVAMDCFLTFR